jgi:hypothetical protein
MTGKVLDECIADFHKPVDHVKGQPSGDNAVIALFVLVGIDVKDDHKERDDVPLEGIAAPQKV